ncbi:OmpA family protein [Alteriqipengyuania lutimaris]|uniref:OmpA family protein n=2 Tax=Alteriqipengyuania lutimaris TaxID=1538146 RepID=A0A395LJH0_9SPHN|nr:OmpA family protein [Alteriqipengyuania lutimaris]
MLVCAIALLFASQTAVGYVERLAAATRELPAQQGPDPAVEVRFYTAGGWPTRHAMLTPNRDLTELERARIAQAIYDIPGVGGVHWTDGTMLASGDTDIESLRCESELLTVLAERTIRFEESSAEFIPGSEELLDELANTLRPCVGTTIAISGHTDTSGSPQVNLALSQDRAQIVRRELIDRGIPGQSLRATGYGSSRTIEGLDPADPANRRIEFRVISGETPSPTPIDTPAAR